MFKRSALTETIFIFLNIPLPREIWWLKIFGVPKNSKVAPCSKPSQLVLFCKKRFNRQGADSCELVSFSGLLNRSDQSVQKCTENMLIWGIVSRRDTSSLETNEILKVYKSVQLFSGGVRSLWMQKKVYKVYKSVQIYMSVFRWGTSSLKITYFLHTFLRQDLASVRKQ